MQLLQHILIDRKHMPRLVNRAYDFLRKRSVPQISLSKIEKHSAREWQERNDQHPCQLRGRVHRVAEQIHDHDERKRSLYDEEMLELLSCHEEQPQKQSDLDDDQQEKDHKSAENESQQTLPCRLDQSGERLAFP